MAQIKERKPARVVEPIKVPEVQPLAQPISTPVEEPVKV